MTVLLVGDDERTARAAQRVLESAAHVVLLAAGVDAAAEILMNQFVDVVVSDLHTDPASEADLLVVVRAFDVDAPVIFVGSVTARESCGRVGALGPVMHVFKSTPKGALLAAVERAPHLRRIAQEEREAQRLGG